MKFTVSARRDVGIITKRRFEKLVSKHLLPLLPGAVIKQNPVTHSRARATVAFRDPCTLSIKPSLKSDFHIEITRSQKFASASSLGNISEYTLAKAFIRAVNIITPAIGSAFERDVVNGLGRRIVARSISEQMKQRLTSQGILDQFSRWATRSYEGKPISASFGVTDKIDKSVNFHDFSKEDFSVVLTNGTDTMIECASNGAIQNYHSLPVPRKMPDFAPHRLAGLAEWAKGEKIGLALNRSGEILVLKHGRLVFVCRRGKWSFLTHEPIITQMGCPQDRNIRREIYSSALDASFARTGACIGVVTSNNVGNGSWKNVVPRAEDYLQFPISTKTKALAKMIDGKKFQDLSRRFRQELLAIDGATLIGHDGTVLAVGAILKIQGGSTGGGRLAAAKTLGQYGLGIKVSMDGPIQGFRGEPDKVAETPTFAVM
jgi:hypothetical protein